MSYCFKLIFYMTYRYCYIQDVCILEERTLKHSHAQSHVRIKCYHSIQTYNCNIDITIQCIDEFNFIFICQQWIVQNYTIYRHFNTNRRYIDVHFTKNVVNITKLMNVIGGCSVSCFYLLIYLGVHRMRQIVTSSSIKLSGQ